MSSKYVHLFFVIDNQRLGLERELKLRDIRDTLYFKPCNFTLSTLEDFVLTTVNKKTNVDATINFSNFVCHKQVQKSPLNVFIELFSQQQTRYFCQSNKTQELIKFWFSALLFPKDVLRVVRCIDIAARV